MRVGDFNRWNPSHTSFWSWIFIYWISWRLKANKVGIFSSDEINPMPFFYVLIFIDICWLKISGSHVGYGGFLLFLFTVSAGWNLRRLGGFNQWSRSHAKHFSFLILGKPEWPILVIDLTVSLTIFCQAYLDQTGLQYPAIFLISVVFKSLPLIWIFCDCGQVLQITAQM